MRPRHKPKREGKMFVPDQRYLAGDEVLRCHNELHMVYRVDRISITKGQTRLMLDPRLEACMVEMRKGVSTAPRLGQVLASGEEQYNTTISMTDNRHRPGTKRRVEEVGEDHEVINEVRVGSVEEVVVAAMGGVGLVIAETNGPVKDHQPVRHQAIRTSNPSSTNRYPTNINNRNNNTLNTRTINNLSTKTRIRVTHSSNRHTSLSLLLWTLTVQTSHTNPLPIIISNPLHSSRIPNSSIHSSSSCHNQVDPPSIPDLLASKLQS